MAGSAMVALSIGACGPEGSGCPAWPELIMVDINGEHQIFVPSWDPCREAPEGGRCIGPDGEITYTATVTRAPVGWTLRASFTGGGCSEDIEKGLVEE